MSAVWATASGGPTSGDGSPAAATKLYTYGALSWLSNVILWEKVGWLRGVLGTYDGYHTLTLWGKLSWGDDPLIASSPSDGLADGARVNPLYTVGLYVIGLNASQSHLATGAGYAVQLAPSNATTGVAEYTNYSAQAIVGNSTIPTVSNYSTVLPVAQTARQIQLVLSVYYRGQGGGLIPVPINGSSWIVAFTYDLVAGKFVRAFAVTGTNGSGPAASLTINLQSVAVGVKAPTFLWIPTTNSTVNGLPVGLQRYTGEQSFDMVVVNSSGPYTSDTIPLPWGGTYTLTLHSGLSDFLVPREEFLSGAFGEGILGGKAPGYNSSGPTPPMLGLTGVQSLISSFGGANPYVELSAYWQNRSIAVGSQGNFSNEKGTGPTSSKSLNIVAVTSPPSNNTGGLPSNPSLLNASNANAPTAAVQSVVTLNITSKPMLDALAAGLLDNATNGVNGTFASVTYQVPFLGFDSALSAALANSVVLSDGLCAPPQSQYPPPPPPSSGILGDFVNAVTSTVQTVGGAIVSLVSVVYTGVVQAAIFVAHLAREAADIGGELLSRAAAAIVYVGKLIESALEAFVAWIWAQVEEFLSGRLSVGTLITPLVAGLTGPIGSVWAGNGHSIQSPGPGLGSAIFGGVMASIAGAAGTILYVLQAAMMILEVLSLGMGTLVSTVVPMLLSLLFSAVSSLGGALAQALAGLTATGSALWWEGVSAAGSIINETASALGKSFTQVEAADLITIIGNLGNYAGVAAAFVAFAVSVGMMVGSRFASGTLSSTLAAVGGLISAIAQFAILIYVSGTSNQMLKLGTWGGAAVQFSGVVMGIYGFITSISALLRDMRAAKPSSNMIMADEVILGLNTFSLGAGSVVFVDYLP